jgi:ABC-type Fe3+ transport system substrate-binding protein
VTVSLHPIGVAAKAPHSNAAKLFIDFVLSKEGQQVVLAIGRTPSRPGIDTKMQAQNLSFSPFLRSSERTTTNTKKNSANSFVSRPFSPSIPNCGAKK